MTYPFPFTRVHPPANLNLAVRSEKIDINLIMIVATLLLVEVEWKVWQMEIFQSTNSCSIAIKTVRQMTSPVSPRLPRRTGRMNLP